LDSSAGDDATAALTMILRYHRRRVSFDDVRWAIFEDRTGAPSAADVIAAAEHFRLHGRGLMLEDPTLLGRIPTPNIAHLMGDGGPFPRRLNEGLAGYLAVVVATSAHHVRWIAPHVGQIDDPRAAFLEFASGVFLVFDEAPAPPHAKLRPVAGNR